MIFLLSYLAFFIVPTSGIRRDLIYEACKRQPSLPFCDSHFLGKPPSDLSAKPKTYDPAMKEIDQWLQGFKDDIDDEDGEIEKSRRLHADKNQYCNKYHQNYKHYCLTSKDGELEGVLNQFCSAFRIACEGIIPGVTAADNFPEPSSLEKNFKVDKKGTDKSGKTEEYCKQFRREYESLCSETPSKQAVEFCQSFKDNCIKGTIFSGFDSSPSSSSTSTSASTSSEEGFLEESFPDDESSSPAEGEGGGSGGKVTEYCEKYSENYNYYCVGDTSGENGKFCSSYRRNCPDKVSSFKEGGTFLGEREKGQESGGVYKFHGTKKEYCEQFAVNYEYYCKGDSDDPKITQKFCPSYKQSCLHVAAEIFMAAYRTTARPANPFVDPDFPDFEHPQKKGTKSKKGRKPKRIRKKRACTPDCDERYFRHCTKECKCDYLYPYVQKFCNPPPLPLFLNTCRLWYNGCPKYERYHYASQFIYSKAEKGKKIEGPVGTQPFSVISPSGEKLPVNVRQPGVGNQRRKDEPWEFANDTDFSGPIRLHQLPGIKSLPPGLKEIVPNVGISNPRKRKAEGEDVPKVPKDGKAKDSVPVVPTDSVFSNAVSQYGAFTDNRGILHRPRSRSPFTKPGLWEPNPDDPHNRDHANKWYYAPKSVNVDWLSGQLAWGAHWAVPAAGVGGTDGFSAVHFPSIGTFTNIPDDYD